MAHEYLNDLTDDLFKIIEKERNKITGFAVDAALAYYDRILDRAKYKSQKWYFQRKLFELSEGFAIGCFKTRKKSTYPEFQTAITEYFKNKSNAVPSK